MQNTIRWRSDRFWYICHYSWSNNYLEPLVKQKWWKFRGLCLHSTSVVILLNVTNSNWKLKKESNVLIWTLKALFLCQSSKTNLKLIENKFVHFFHTYVCSVEDLLASNTKITISDSSKQDYVEKMRPQGNRESQVL